MSDRIDRHYCEIRAAYDGHIAVCEHCVRILHSLLSTLRISVLVLKTPNDILVLIILVRASSTEYICI